MDEFSISNLTNDELLKIYKEVDTLLKFFEKEKEQKEKDEENA